MSNCIKASIASGFKIKKITMLHKDRRDANDTGSMVCLGMPQTSRLQILWWWYSILTVYNKESWLIIGIEILSPIRFFWILQSQYFISHTLAARAWIVLCFLQCVIFITLKGFQWDHRKECIDCSVPRQKAIHAEEYQYRGRTNKVKTLDEDWEREMKARGLYAWLFCCSVAWVAGCAKLSIHLSMPIVLLHLPVVPKELATHTHTHKILCTACAHRFLQVLELTQTHTQKK